MQAPQPRPLQEATIARTFAQIEPQQAAGPVAPQPADIFDRITARNNAAANPPQVAQAPTPAGPRPPEQETINALSFEPINMIDAYSRFLSEQQAPTPADRIARAPVPASPISRPPTGITAPTPADTIDRKGSLDLGGFRLPGIFGGIQNLDHAIANASGPFPSNVDNYVRSIFKNPRGYRSPQEVRSGPTPRRTGGAFDAPDGTRFQGTNGFDYVRTSSGSKPFENVGRTGGSQSYGRNDSGRKKQYNPQENRWA